jgi:hypothetical protein
MRDARRNIKLRLNLEWLFVGMLRISQLHRVSQPWHSMHLPALDLQPRTEIIKLFVPRAMTEVPLATRVRIGGPNLPFSITSRGTGPSGNGRFGVISGRHDISNVEQNACAKDLTKDKDDVEARHE